MFTCAIGQDSHRFEERNSKKPLMLCGVKIPACPGLAGNSDADVVLHALTNAVSGISGVNILGRISDRMCLKQGIRDSRAYLQKALESLQDCRLVHVSVSIEAQRPKLQRHIPAMRRSLARLCGCAVSDIGITATTGEGLTSFGRGEGIQAFVVVSAVRLMQMRAFRRSAAPGRTRKTDC
jgi:2-C-methyl-D-erythritol 2,4-cyclodiphosphate synthase